MKPFKLLLSVFITFVITTFIAHQIYIPHLLWKTAIEIGLAVAFFQLIFGGLAIQVWRKE